MPTADRQAAIHHVSRVEALDEQLLHEQLIPTSLIF
jgi:hypothetical protein